MKEYLTARLPGDPPIIPEGEQLHVFGDYTFSNDAGQLVVADEPSIEIVNAGDGIEDVWKAVEAGHYGLVPIENSSDGIVPKHFDRIIRGNVRILGEVHLHVRMCIGGLPGATLEGATDVYSHSKGLGQSKNRLNQMNIPAKNRHAVSATEAAVRKVLELNNTRHICLSSRRAIEELGLEVLAEDVADLEGEKNITQFYAVRRNGKQKLPNVESPYHGAVIYPDHERIGVLNDILGIIRAQRGNLASLHSDPVPDENGHRFFTEIELEDKEAMDLLKRKLENCSAVKKVDWIGSWGRRIYSDSILTSQFGDDDYSNGSQKPVANGRIQSTRRYHGLEFTPEDYPGVLFDVTHRMRTADINLTYVRSRSVGPKEYTFITGLDALKTNKSRLRLLRDELENAKMLNTLTWLGSTDSRDRLKKLLVT